MRLRVSIVVVAVTLLCVQVFAAAPTPTFTWTGAGGDGKWSTPANWSPAGPPSAGADLNFPASAAIATTNDLPSGTSFGHITVECGYTLGGNPFTITGGVSQTVSCYIGDIPTIAADVVLGGTQTIGWYPRFTGTTTFAGAISTGTAEFIGPVKGSATLAGSPSFVAGGTLSGTLSGPDNNSVLVAGDVGSLDITANSFRGHGTVRKLQTAQIALTNDTSQQLWSPSPVAATLHTKDFNLTLGNNIYYPTQFDILPTGSDKIIVTGTVTLAGLMDLGTVTADVTPGQTFVILDNDGTDPVAGTFSGKPEGTLLSSGSATFKLSYKGGDGNDVTLTVTSLARTWTGAGGNHLWSNAGNWSPAGAPKNGDDLIFPAGFNGATAVDDLAGGLTFATITFNSSIHLSGNAFVCKTFAGQAPYPDRAIIDNDVEISAPTMVMSLEFHGRVKFDGDRYSQVPYTAQYSRFAGPIEGSASIRNYNSAFVGGGSYDGSIFGESDVEVRGSFPNATVSMSANVFGSGTVGNLFGFMISPGSPTVPDFAQFEFTSSTFWGYTADIGATSSDRVVIHGPLTLTSYSTLTVRIASGTPAVGTVYTIIQKDGTDKITGIFSGYPEGAVINGSGSQLRISYHGGDGNDVTLTVLGAAKTWTGAGGDGRMANPLNWSSNSVPVSGDAVSFPATATLLTITNDLPAGISFSTMSFGSRTELTGNAVTVTQSLALSPYGLVVRAPMKLSGTIVTGSPEFYQPVEIAGAVEFRGNSTTDFWSNLNGTGSITAHAIYLYQDGSFAGMITGTGYVIPHNNAAMPNASVNAGTLDGAGTFADVTARTFSTTELTARAVTIDGQSNPMYIAAYTARINTGAASIVHGQRFTIAGPLIVEISGTPAPGTVVKFLDNLGAEPIHGTFNDHPEGSIWSVSGTPLRISYKGGDGNDATLTVLQPSATTLAQSAATSRLGDKYKLTATVTSSAGQPAGSVTFYRGSTAIRSATVVNGVAAIDINEPLGTYDYVATYDGGGNVGPSTSQHVSHTVIRALPLVTFSRAGSDIVLVAVSRSAALDVDPTGSVHVSGEIDVTAPVANGGIAFNTHAGTSAAGTHHFTVTYLGDANYDELAVPYDVVVAPPAVSVFGAEVMAGDKAALTLKLTRGSRDAINVNWSTRDGSAVAGTDYAAQRGSVTFPPNTTIETINVQTLGRTPQARSFYVTIDGATADVHTREAEVRITPIIEGASHVTLEYARAATGPLTLELYLPESTDRAADSPRRPLVIALEARDWWSAQETKPVGLREASRGYVVAVVRYRTNAEAKFPAQIDDLKAAVRFLRANAPQYGIDASHIGVWGIGAAGHLAALLGTSAGDPERVQAVVEWQGPTDLSATNAPCGRLSADASLLLGAMPPREADPVTFVDPNDPPFLIMHGGADCNVPSVHAIRLADALRAAGLAPKLSVDDTRAGIEDGAWRDPDVFASVDSFLDQNLKPPTKRRAAR
jgi:hypothetical protein